MASGMNSGQANLVRNLGCIFAGHLGDDRPAVADLSGAAPRTFSYDDLNQMADAVARGLAARGLEAGDRVGILALNRIEYLAVFFGAMRIGAVPAPINIKLSADMVDYIVRDAGCKLAFFEDEFEPLVPKDIARIAFGPGFDAFLDPGSFEAVEPAPDAVALQPYTSGSTGRPKGVLLDHAGQMWGPSTGGWMNPDGAYLVAAPLYHKNALMVTKSAFYAGARIVLMPRFEAKTYLSAVETYRPSTISGVPAMISMLMLETDALARTDLSSVREVSMGSAPASPLLLRRVREVFNDPKITIQYGVTEAGPRMFGAHPDGLERPLGSCGVPLAGGEAKLVGDPSAPDDPGGPHVGELWVRNPGVMLGYHNLPEATAAKLPGGGWFRTGDILRRDEAGFYWFVSRADDMFNCGGENIYPAEVEAVLEKHPAVAQSAVVPTAHAVKGEAPVAFVVPSAPGAANEAELKNFALANGPAYAHPRRIFFLESLPLASTNKIDRARLKADAARLAADLGGAE